MWEFSPTFNDKGGAVLSFVSQIMRKASIVERSDKSVDEKAESFMKLAEEADVIVDRMESSLSRLSPAELETLGPGRHKEMDQLKEAVLKLKIKAKELIKRRTGAEKVSASEATV